MTKQPKSAILKKARFLAAPEMKTIEIGVVGKFVTVQSVCAFTALTVRKHGFEGKNPIGAADLEWIFACNLPCIRREAPGEVPVGVKVLNSYENFMQLPHIRTSSYSGRSFRP